jgi:hypothetical protein
MVLELSATIDGIERRALQHDSAAENFAYGFKEAAAFVSAEILRSPEWIDAGVKATLIGINVADPGDEILL